MTIIDLKRSIPNAEVVARNLYGIEFKRGRARCPRSENHRNGDQDPSLRFDAKRNRIFCASQNCFGEKGVDAIAFVQAMDGGDVRDAMRKLGDHYGFQSPAGHTRPKTPASGARTISRRSAQLARQQLEKTGYRVVGEYLYTPELRKVRLEHADRRQPGKDKPEKTFRWEHLDDGQWWSGDGGRPKPLYVNAVFRERDQVEWALGVEGEGKADVAGELGIPAFSFKAVTAKQALMLAGCDVVLWPDNDDPGRRQVASAAEGIAQGGVARSLKVVRPLTEFPIAADIVDVVRTLKWDKERISVFLKTAVGYSVSRSNGKNTVEPELHTVYTLTELRRTEIPEPESIVEGLLRASETITIVGKPKAGKSRLIQQLAICLSRGTPFLGLQVRRRFRVLILDLENRPAGARTRFLKMSVPDTSDDNITIYAPETLVENSVSLTSATTIAAISRLVRERQPDVLVIDTWRLALGGDENKADVVVRALKTLSGLRQIKPDLAVILVHHLRKQQGEHAPRLRIDPAAWVEASSGHFSLIGHCDACYGLEREVDSKSKDELIVFSGVARSGAPPMLLLEEDEETLLFNIARGEDSLIKLLTTAEKGLWDVAKGLIGFRFTDLLTASGTKNRKAIASMLRKATSSNLVLREGQLYHIAQNELDCVPAIKNRTEPLEPNRE